MRGFFVADESWMAFFTSVQILQRDSWKQKLPHHPGVLVGIIAIGMGMVHSLGEPKLFLPLMCLVQRVHHPCGYEIVGIAMDKEHGAGALCHLPEGTCLGKVPSIHSVAQE